MIKLPKTWLRGVLGKVVGGTRVKASTNGTLNGTLNQTDRKVLDFIANNEGCRASAIIAALSILGDTLNKVIIQLVADGIVGRKISKRKVGHSRKRAFGDCRKVSVYRFLVRMAIRLPQFDNRRILESQKLNACVPFRELLFHELTLPLYRFEVAKLANIT